MKHFFTNFTKLLLYIIMYSWTLYIRCICFFHYCNTNKRRTSADQGFALGSRWYVWNWHTTLPVERILQIIYINTFKFLVAGIVIAETKTWIYPFYIWGGQGVLWYIIALFTVFSKPSTHPFITPMEADYLKENMIPKSRSPPIPWIKIIKSPATLSLLACQIGHDYVIYLLCTDLPKYMKYVLKFNIDSNGWVK